MAFVGIIPTSVPNISRAEELFQKRVNSGKGVWFSPEGKILKCIGWNPDGGILMEDGSVIFYNDLMLRWQFMPKSPEEMK